MDRSIFVNLPVTDLGRATAFYAALGASQNAQFSDEIAAGMSFSETIHVMLLTHAKFGQFTPRPIADARVATEVLLCLSADSRDAVDRLVETAASAGGRSDPAPPQDHGFMYGRSVEDPDGHICEIVWLDQAAMAEACRAAAAASA